MRSQDLRAPQEVLYRLHAAQNKHDLAAFAACFASDFSSDDGICPGLRFAGRDRVRTGWIWLLSRVPDLSSELLRSVVEGDTVWAEWRWYGTHNDGAPRDWRGVTIFRVENEQIVWARLYIERMQPPGNSTAESKPHEKGGLPRTS